MLLEATNPFTSTGRSMFWRIAPPGGRSVLLVEHRDEVFARLEEDLRSHGFDVERASTPREASAKFATTHGNLMIVNRELSAEESGWLLVSKWALLRRQRRIWLYTAWPGFLDDHWCRFTKVEKLLYHEGNVWRLSETLLAQLRSTCPR